MSDGSEEERRKSSCGMGWNLEGVVAEEAVEGASHLRQSIPPRLLRAILVLVETLPRVVRPHLAPKFPNPSLSISLNPSLSLPLFLLVASLLSFLFGEPRMRRRREGWSCFWKRHRKFFTQCFSGRHVDSSVIKMIEFIVCPNPIMKKRKKQTRLA